MQTLFIVTNNSRAVMIDIIVKVFERSHPCQTKFRWTEHAQMCGQASKMPADMSESVMVAILSFFILSYQRVYLI